MFPSVPSGTDEIDAHEAAHNTDTTTQDNFKTRIEHTPYNDASLEKLLHPHDQCHPSVFVTKSMKKLCSVKKLIPIPAEPLVATAVAVGPELATVYV